MAASVRLDNKCFLHVFICFTVTSLTATAILLYYISRALDFPRKSSGKLWASGPGDPEQQAHIWSRDPMVMNELAGVRARGKHGTVESLTLTQVNFSDSCFSFVWTRPSQNPRKYKVLITNLHEPAMAAMSAVTGERDMQFVQCGLNVSTPYLVNLTAVGEDVGGAAETASGIMWTTHQVPHPPGLPRIISVTETTVTVTLPPVTLTQGPLTAIEIRIKPVQTDDFLEATKSHPVFWASFFKRHKRSSGSLQPRRVLPRTVEIPDSWLQSVDTRDNTEDNRRDDVLLDNMEDNKRDDVLLDNMQDNRRVDVLLDNMQDNRRDDVLLEVNRTSRPLRNRETQRNFDLSHTDIVVANKDFPYTAVLNKDGGESEGKDGKNVLIHNQQQRTKSEDSGFHTSNESRFVKRRDDQVNVATAGLQQLTAPANGELEDATLSTVGSRPQPLVRQPTSGDLMASKTAGNGHVIPDITSSPLHDHDDISHHERLVSAQRYQGSDVTWPDLGVVPDMSRRHVTSSLFQLASQGQGMAFLLQLVRDIEQLFQPHILSDTSSLGVLQASSLQPDSLSDTSNLGVLQASPHRDGMQAMGNISIACHKCQGHRDNSSDDIKVAPASPLSPRSTSWNIADLASNSKAFPRESPPAARRTRAVSRRKRSLLGFGRQPRRQLIADDVREVEDRLAVDPYLTLDVLGSVTEQPIRVKTGCGYFVTDHHGVRHPYFNNSLLERGLRRYAHFQEAKDFVLYSEQSLLNRTQFRDLDRQLLTTRLTKVMDANRRRRIKLFLDMFEDFLFWNQDMGNNNQLGGTAVPLEAKLGLPPGLPVARVLEAGPRNLTLGDEVQHGPLPNPALQPGTEYEVVIVVLSTVVDVSKHSWISVNFTTLPEQPRMVSDVVLLIVGATAIISLLVFLLTQLFIWCTSTASTTSLGAVWADV